eukprot:10999052-Alexandrium_andersonii.AAC.1
MMQAYAVLRRCVARHWAFPATGCTSLTACQHGPKLHAPEHSRIAQFVWQERHAQSCSVDY